MNRREVAALAVRLLGIYCILQGLLVGVFAIIFLGAGEVLGPRGPFAWVANVVPIVLLFMVGLILLRRADGFARRMVGDAAEPGAAEPWTSRQVLAVALAVVGAYLAATSLPHLAGQIVTAVESVSKIAAKGDQAPVGRTAVLEVLSLLRAALRLGLGVYIFLAAPRLSDLWHRIRQLPPAAEAKA